MLDGFGNCEDCVWYNQPEGCDVERDSTQCKLNRKPNGSEHEAENNQK